MSTPEYPGQPEQPPTEPTVPLPPTHHPYGAVPPQPPQPPQPPAYGSMPPMPPVAPPGYYGGYAPAAPTDGLAIASLVTGIVGLTMICAYGLGLIPAIIAIVLGRKSMKKIDASGGQIGGRGLAQAGFIMGIISTVIIVVLVAVGAIFFTALFSTDCFGDGCD
ncbi:hypothetical protein GCM10011584_21480 [Nocardioides phosphati]|uniref:DUF4190 domain-containing protein n=1 Tax=Nocardioides phosphati TaxID=1867775 RepID=A0ABQ2NA78_9ACTN|nr:DUF4190 domain-containing protein [Nocardioides phosphati]GGO90206.1 hypothetical protein GCM10011584_21480 [Nocardioides phosphati]